MGFFNTILDFLFPENCLFCGKNNERVCAECINSSPGAERESAEWVFPIFDYRHPPIKKAVWLLKYQGKRGLAKIFAEALYDRMLEEMADLKMLENFTEPLLIPIPLDRKRRHERGFNQAELVCRELVKLDEEHNFILRTDLLVKIKDAKHQARIENRAERLRNIIGSFGLADEEQNKEELRGRNIVLLDDVVTTGATLSEARKTLRLAGARKVIAFTVAH